MRTSAIYLIYGLIKPSRMILYFVQFTDKTTLGSSSILGIKVSLMWNDQWYIDTERESRQIIILLQTSTSIALQLGHIQGRFSDPIRSWLGTIFYLSYLIFEWPQTLGLQKLPPGKWMACNILVWGV
jgi:ACS family allantoate permease-like MFS transporter